MQMSVFLDVIPGTQDSAVYKKSSNQLREEHK